MKVSLKSQIIENCSLLSNLKNQQHTKIEKLPTSIPPQGDLEQSNLSITLSRDSSEARIPIQKNSINKPRKSFSLLSPQTMLSPRTQFGQYVRRSVQNKQIGRSALQPKEKDLNFGEAQNRYTQSLSDDRSHLLFNSQKDKVNQKSTHFNHFGSQIVIQHTPHSSIDKDEELACQTIEDERDEVERQTTHNTKQVKQLKVEIAIMTRQQTERFSSQKKGSRVGMRNGLAFSVNPIRKQSIIEKIDEVTECKGWDESELSGFHSHRVSHLRQKMIAQKEDGGKQIKNHEIDHHKQNKNNSKNANKGVIKIKQNSTLDLNLQEELQNQEEQNEKSPKTPQDKLELLKSKNKIQTKQNQQTCKSNEFLGEIYYSSSSNTGKNSSVVKPFGFQSKIQTGKKIGSNSNEKKLQLNSNHKQQILIEKNFQIPSNNPKIPDHQQIKRKRSLLYQKPTENQQRISTSNETSVKSSMCRNLKQSALHIPGLKELTIQASSLFNISIDKIAQTPMKEQDITSNLHLTNLNPQQSLFNQHNYDPHPDASLNTTHQMALLVNQVLHPSEKSNFHFTPKFFKPSQNPNNQNQAQNQQTTQGPLITTLALSNQNSLATTPHKTNINLQFCNLETNECQEVKEKNISQEILIMNGYQSNDFNQKDIDLLQIQTNENRNRLNSSFERLESEVLGLTPQLTQKSEEANIPINQQLKSDVHLYQIKSQSNAYKPKCSSPIPIQANLYLGNAQRESPLSHLAQNNVHQSHEVRQFVTSEAQEISRGKEMYYTPKSMGSNQSQTGATTQFQTLATNSQLLTLNLDTNYQSSGKKENNNKIDKQY